MRRPKNRNFLLMEVLIALALVTSCASLLIRPHLKICARQEQLADQLVRERAADLAMGQVRQQLYEHQIPWNAMRHGEREGDCYKAPLGLVELSGKQFEASCRISVAEQHHKNNSGSLPARDYRLLEVKIALASAHHHEVSEHHFFVVTERQTKKSP